MHSIFMYSIFLCSAIYHFHNRLIYTIFHVLDEAAVVRQDSNADLRYTVHALLGAAQLLFA